MKTTKKIWADKALALIMSAAMLTAIAFAGAGVAFASTPNEGQSGIYPLNKSEDIADQQTAVLGVSESLNTTIDIQSFCAPMPTANTYPLMLSCEAIGIGYDPKVVFTYRFTFDNSGEYSYATSLSKQNGQIKDGGTITLMPNDTLVINALPVKCKYVIQPLNIPVGFACSPAQISSTIGTINSKRITNAYSPITGGMMVVSNEIVGSKEDQKNEFEYKLSLFKGSSGSYPYAKGDTYGKISGNETFKLKNGETMKIYGLPNGSANSVEELITLNSNYVCTANGAQKNYATFTAVNGWAFEAKFVNTYNSKPAPVEKGNLVISNSVGGPGADTMLPFNYKLTLYNSSQGYSTSGNNAFVTTKINDEFFSSAIFQLTNGQTYTIYDIPQGAKYKIEQSTVKDYTTFANNSQANSLSSTIAPGTNNVKFSNTYINPDIGKAYADGDLVITKDVSGIQTTQAFTLTFGVPDGNYQIYRNGMFEGYISNGSNTMIKPSDTIVIRGIPKLSPYTIIEESSEKFIQYVNGVEGSTAKGIVPEQGFAQIKFTNVYAKKTGFNAGDLVIANNVVGVNTDHEFSYKLTLPQKSQKYNYTTSNGESGQMSATCGFTLQDGCYIVFYGLSEGDKFTVEEQNVPTGYTVTINGVEAVKMAGTISGKEYTEAQFKNSYSGIVPYDEGDLIVKLEIKGAYPSSSKGANEIFTFKFNVDSTQRYSFTYGKQIGLISNNDIFTLKPGESFIIHNLLDTTFTVREIAVPTYYESFINGAQTATGEGMTKKGTYSFLIFTNKPKAESPIAQKPVAIDISALVTLDGKTPPSKSFAFLLLTDDDTTQSKVFNTNRNISWGKLSFAKAGSYKYKISQVEGSNTHYLYDNATYPITVSVKEDNEGKLTASVEYFNSDGKVLKSVPSFLNLTDGTGSPGTGDISNLGLWAAIAIASLTLLAAIAIMPALRNKGKRGKI